MISSVSQYIFAVKHLNMMSRNLAAKMIYPIFDDVFPDRPKCHIGNSVIVFEVICDGKKPVATEEQKPVNSKKKGKGKETNTPDTIEKTTVVTENNDDKTESEN